MLRRFCCSLICVEFHYPSGSSARLSRMGRWKKSVQPQKQVRKLMKQPERHVLSTLSRLVQQVQQVQRRGSGDIGYECWDSSPCCSWCCSSWCRHCSRSGRRWRRRKRCSCPATKTLSDWQVKTDSRHFIKGYIFCCIWLGHSQHWPSLQSS